MLARNGNSLFRVLYAPGCIPMPEKSMWQRLAGRVVGLIHLSWYAVVMPYLPWHCIYCDASAEANIYQQRAKWHHEKWSISMRFTWNCRLCIALFKNICVVLHLIICGIDPVVLNVVGIFILAIEFVSTICEIALMCMPPYLANDKSTLVHAMSLCLEALTKSTSMTPCGITRPQ